MTAPGRAFLPALGIGVTALFLASALALATTPVVQDVDAADPSAGAAAPPHVALVEGDARLMREGEERALEPGALLLPGDVITTPRGRAELVWDEGSIVTLDGGTRLDMVSSTLARLTVGHLRVDLISPAGTRHAFRVDTPSAVVRLLEAGEYRIDVVSRADPSGGGRTSDSDETQVAVARGSAEVLTDEGTMPVLAGEQTRARAGAVPEHPRVFNVAARDAFDYWVDERARERRSSQSASYLSSELRSYGPVFDEAGTWEADTQYGYVWYPRVAANWRPYSLGSWQHYPQYGWTWIDTHRWGWPTHHYGRWGLGARGSWFWIPTRRWGPAWVAWINTPAYVGWCPLGWYGQPVLPLGVGPWRSPYGYAARGYRYSPWSAWTVVPTHRFGRPGPIRSYVVSGSTLDRDLAAFAAARPVAPGARANRAAPNVVRHPIPGRVDPRRQPRSGQAVGGPDQPYERAQREMGVRPRPVERGSTGDAPVRHPLSGRPPPSANEPPASDPASAAPPPRRRAVPREGPREAPPRSRDADGPQREEGTRRAVRRHPRG